MSEKSIAEIIAEIKAKIPEIDAQLNAIDVGDLPETLAKWWQLISEKWLRVMSLMDETPEAHDEMEMVRNILFDLRNPLGTVLGGLDGLIYFATDAKDFAGVLTAEVLDQLRNVLADVHWIIGNFDRLADWWRSEWENNSRGSKPS